MNTNATTNLLAAFTLLASWSSASFAIAADGPKFFNIQQQPLATALNEFARQSDRQILFSTEVVNAKRTDGIKGELEPEIALKKLLEGTGLGFRLTTDQTILIDATGDTANVPVQRNSIRLAQSGREVRSAGQTGQTGQDALSAQTIDEVVVTAQKREERLQDVPISISVLSGVDLDRSSVQGISETLARVPGVSAGEVFQGGTTQLNVRGVGASGAIASGSSPIAYYLDSVPFGFVKTAIAPDANAYDLDRVEVLRGPQGTLYGASAQNGVVRVLTKNANLSAFELKSRAAVSSTERGGENYRGDFALNVPIVEGKLAIRAVGGYQDLSGWLEKPNAEDVNDAEIRNMRLKLNAQPNDQLSIGLSAWIARSDFGAPSIARDDGQRDSVADEPISTDFEVFGLTLGYDFAHFSITSTTSHIDYVNDGFMDLAPRGVPNSVLQTTLEAETFSQEILVNSTHAGPWRWSVGGMYRDSKDGLFQLHRLFLRPQIFDDLSESYAAFGELTRLFAGGRLELTGGLRYFADRVQLKEHSNPTGPVRATFITSSNEFDAVSPRGVLTWHPRDRMSVYASYSEGFRSGSHQAPSVQASFPTLAPPGPDNLKNYEVGAKGSVWNDRLTFDAAAYYIDWQDAQQPIGVNLGAGRFVSALVNGESASGPGFEIGLTGELADRLTAGVNFAWNDLTVDADVVNSSASGDIVLYGKGDRLSLSPERTIGAWLDYALPIGQTGYEASCSASINYTSEQFINRIVGGTTVVRSTGDAMSIGRVSFSVDTPHHWRATLFADNVTDENGVQVPDQFPDYDTRVRPRTIGVQLEYQFE